MIYIFYLSLYLVYVKWLSVLSLVRVDIDFIGARSFKSSRERKTNLLKSANRYQINCLLFFLVVIKYECTNQLAVEGLSPLIKNDSVLSLYENCVITDLKKKRRNLSNILEKLYGKPFGNVIFRLKYLLDNYLETRNSVCHIQ